MPFEMNKTGKTYVAFFHCMYKISPCRIVYEFNSDAGQLGPKYIKNPLEQRRLMCAVSPEHMYTAITKMVR